VVIKILGLKNPLKRKKMDKKKLLLIGGIAALGYEGYRAYNIQNGIVLTYNNFKLSIQNGKLVIKFNLIITNQSGKNCELVGVSGNLKYMGNVLLNYSANIKKPLELTVGNTKTLPITVVANTLATLTMIAGGTSKVVEMSYNIGVRVNLLGFIPISLPVRFSEKMDLTPYIQAATNLLSTVTNMLKNFKPSDKKVEVIIDPTFK